MSQAPSSGIIGGGLFSLPQAGGAAIGAGLALFGTSSANRQIRRQHSLTQQAINDQITRSRVKRVTDSSLLSQQSQTVLGGVQNQLANAQGASTNLVIGQIAERTARSQFSIDTQSRDSIQDLTRQKTFVTAQANSSSQSPFTAMIKGAFTGYQMGSQLQNVLNANRAAESSRQEFDAQAPIHESLSDISELMARVRQTSVGLELEFKSDRVDEIGARLGGINSQIQIGGNILQQLGQGVAPAVQTKGVWNFR